MSYFSFDNKQIHYTEYGTGTPLLLLHGNTASSKMFDHIVDLYKKEFHVILIDFLGHGQSDRLSEFSTDLWFNEAKQVIAFLREHQYTNVNLIGCSGGALVAINVALEAPELINKVIADSFEGEHSLKLVTDTIREDRETSKEDEASRLFYFNMHGDDWEQVVDHDTRAICKHGAEIGGFFHKSMHTLEPDILLTGSKADEFVCAIAPDYFEAVYGALLEKIGHGQLHLFETGGHPAMLTSPCDFYKLSNSFFK